MSQYYATHSQTSNPGAYAHLFDNLPTDLEGISKVTQGLIYHYFADEKIFGWKPPQERMPEINTRTMPNMLETIIAKDDRPLTESRAYEDRMVGCCRDFALLACAILRHHGIPARLRYGFASYFVPEYWIDHVVVDTWTGERWQRFDPEVAGLPDFKSNLFELDEMLFVTGGRVWQMCRSEGADPDRFGLGPDVAEVRGWWMVRERLQLDVAALNKIELLCWDSMEGLQEGNPEDEKILDQMAELSLNPDYLALHQRCTEDERWCMPSSVQCFHPAVGASTVVVS
ncbi:MAG: transglutaminase-like domain-containing protein [Chloroflexota bacterium]